MKLFILNRALRMLAEKLKRSLSECRSGLELFGGLFKKDYLTLCPVRNRIFGCRFIVGIVIIRLAVELVARWGLSILIVGKFRLQFNSNYSQVNE